MKTILIHLSMVALAASSVHAAEYITDMSVVTEARGTENPYHIIGPTASVTSITTGSGTFSNFAGPTSSLKVGSGNVDATTHRLAGSEGATIYPNEADTLLGNNLMDATLTHGDDVEFRVMFGQEIFDNDSGADTDFDLFYTELVISSNENFSIQAITGGTLENPIYGGTSFLYDGTYRNANGGAFTGVRTSSTDSDNILTALFREDNSTTLVGHYGGMGFDLSSDLGVDSLIGLRYFTSSGSDPAAFLAVIPEPSSFALLAGAMAILSLAARFRRGR